MEVLVFVEVLVVEYGESLFRFGNFYDGEDMEKFDCFLVYGRLEFYCYVWCKKKFVV